jgi:hypothetical protein
MTAAVRIAVFGAVLLGSVIVPGSLRSPAGAGHCMGSTTTRDDGGSVSAECHEKSPGSQPVFVEWSEEDRYAYWCGGTYSGAASVAVEYEGRATEEQVALNGFDPSGVYDRHRVTCTGSDGGFLFSAVFMDEVTPPVSPEVLRAQAEARLVLAEPVLGSTPPGDAPAVVNTDTWFWVDTPWEPVVESQTQGFVTVSVVATPKRVTWDPRGDGQAVFVCLGPGEVYSPEVFEAGSSCTHRYERTSVREPDGAFDVTGTVRWELTWAINGADQGVFATVDRTGEAQKAVGEIQAVEGRTQ